MISAFGIHMRAALLSVCLCLALSEAAAQDKELDARMQLKPMAVSKVLVDTGYAVYLPMAFNSSHITDFSQLAKIKDLNSVYGIDLVYTRFREVDSFNQPKLNYKRYAELKKMVPALFHKKDLVWRVIEQQEARTKEVAQNYFHGFVIYLKNDVPPEISAREIETIKSVLSTYYDTMEWIPEKVEWKVKRSRIETGKYLPRNEKKRREGILYDSRGIWFREPEVYIRKDSIIKKKSGGYYRKIGYFDTSYFKGTSEFNLLARRKWSQKMAVVTDVTGSMTPFSTQVMLWIKFNPKVLDEGRFVFFNDGDNKPDPYKIIGKTGGIYFAPEHEFDSVLQVMTLAMAKGMGGDIPENDLEAVKGALERWPDTDTVLLIADNEAPVKDLTLLAGLKKPVSVMVCGVDTKIHPDYIKITTATGGKLFVLETEVRNLKGIKNGEKVQIGKSLFQYQKGGLYKVK